MAAQPLGSCSLCGQQTSKSAIARHLAACAPKHDPPGGAPAEWIHLRVDGGGPYWLDLEVQADARLEQLDRFLRRTWLECCGHLSDFYMPGSRQRPSQDAALPRP
jgi:hypothetical protein